MPPPIDTTVPITVSRSDSTLGLLRLGVVADGSGLLPGPIDLRAEPIANSAMLVTVTRWSDLMAEEIAYEEPALIVYRVDRPWVLVSTRDHVRGWIKIPDGAAMVPLAELLPERLTYLTEEWDGRLHGEPGSMEFTEPAPQSGAGRPSINVTETREIAGALWLRVELLADSPCEGNTPPAVVAEGWIPAWLSGQPTAWYYSRGC